MIQIVDLFIEGSFGMSRKKCRRSCGVGGQAVLEGVMMKNKDEYAVAVRTPNNEIVVDKQKCKSISEKYRFFCAMMQSDDWEMLQSKNKKSETAENKK